MTWTAAPFRILAVAAVCVLALVGLVVREGMARDAGQEVILPMEPIDPRSLLSGHYVIVSLQETLAAPAVCPPLAADFDGETWVALAPYEGRHRAVGEAINREKAADMGPITVRGRLFCNEPTAASEGVEAQPGWVRAELGPERFHINQTEAQRIERLMRDPDAQVPVSAILSIGSDGRARLKGLIVEGQRLELGWT